MAHVGRKAARKIAFRHSSSGNPKDTASITVLSVNENTIPVSPIQNKKLDHASHAPTPEISTPFREDVETELDSGNPRESGPRGLPNAIGSMAPASVTHSLESNADDDLSFLESRSPTNSLPFLRRNLLKGFEGRFLQSTQLSGAFPFVHIIVPRNEEEVEQYNGEPWSFSQTIYHLICPFCTLFKPFRTIHHLVQHIDWDHDLYRVTWKLVQDKGAYELKFTNRNVRHPSLQPVSNNSKGIWGRSLQKPVNTDDQLLGQRLRNEGVAGRKATELPSSSQELAITPQLPLKMRVAQLSGVIHSPSLYKTPHSKLSVGRAWPSEKRAVPRSSHSFSKSFGSPLGISTSTNSPQPFKPPVREITVISSEEENDQEKSPLRSGLSTRPLLEVSKTEPNIKINPENLCLLSRQVRAATEPASSQRSPENPTSRPPCLPTATRSSRPCGPFLYDLIPTPSTVTGECIAVFKEDEWYAEHQEEEIFELASMLDEDKVIAALWSRWMLVHRTVFLASRYSGVLSFIESSCEMIRKAAGRDALRAFLLVLIAHNCLSPAEVAQLLRTYDRLANEGT